MSDAYVIEPGGDDTLHVWLAGDEELAELLAEVLGQYPYILYAELISASEGYTHGEFDHYLSVIYGSGMARQARGVVAMHCKYLDVSQ